MADVFSADDQLPSYDVATTRDPVSVVAPFIRRRDLFNCSLVCRAWHDSVASELWGEPDSCFGFGEKNPLASFVLFFKALPGTLAHTRELVHTLNLERCLASIYTNLPDSWFSTLLILLPRLRRLLLPAISFLGHGSLLGKPSIKGDLPHQNLYHLNISNLTNTTSKSLVGLLTNLTPTLKVLDLSRTNSAGHPDVLRAIASQLQNIKSLKLRWLKLTDDAIAILARRIQVRVERLDFTGNLLTDGIAKDLLDWCFMPPEFEVAMDGNETQARRPAAHESDDEEDAEFGDEEEWMTAEKLQRREFRNLEVLVPDIFGNVPPSAARDKGLTHLHISNNRISSVGVCQLLNSTRLRTLDCGVLLDGNSLSSNDGQRAANDLITAIMFYGFRKLRNLRINQILVLDSPPGSQKQSLLDISKLPRLKTLALTGIPYSTSDERFVKSLNRFLDTLPGGNSNLKTIVLELMEPEAPEMGFYDLVSPVTDSDTIKFFEESKDDFSFFEDERDVPDGPSGSKSKYRSANSPGAYGESVDILDIVSKWRGRCQQQGKIWKGNIRILRDLGGAEVSERGIEGNRWSILVSESSL
ncbi:hypothetical protein TWF694_008702 [Orbilia ellipsospora]|uniref:F-box domain-containing protein n=1 Tax=Orbilia ellipsospora TaxID=2528407 RepID=A0AAV9XDX7_9PEZI